MIGLWRKRLIEYFKLNRENVYTANDVVPEDCIILFKNEAGANWYDRIVPISLLLDTIAANSPYRFRDDIEVLTEGQTVFNLSFSPSNIAMVFVQKQLNGPLDYTIVGNVLTMHNGLHKYDKLTVIG